MTPDVRRQLVEHSRTIDGTLSPAWPDRVAAYLDLLQEWNRRLRLTGERDPTELALHHVADCMPVAPLVPASGCFVDIGSGAGLPGLVIAICRDDVRGTLVEARRRPASFLREACRVLGLPHVTVVEGRAEAFAVEPGSAGAFDIVVARAVRADVFLPLAAPLLASGGLAVVMQTPRAGAPLLEAQYGYAPHSVRDYRLPDGTPRRLQLLRRVC